MVVRLSTLLENIASIEQYDSKDRGSLDGYVVNTSSEQLENYLHKFSINSDIILDLKNKYRRIAIIKNMYIDDEYRGIGIGNKLLSNAIDEAYENDAEAIILIADIYESNDFDIKKWYEKFGFEQITDTNQGPLMILDES